MQWKTSVEVSAFVKCLVQTSCFCQSTVPAVTNCEIHNKKLVIQIQGVEFDRCACSNRIVDNKHQCIMGNVGHSLWFVTYRCRSERACRSLWWTILILMFTRAGQLTSPLRVR